MLKCLFVGFCTIDIYDRHQSLGGAAGVISRTATTLGVESHLLSILSHDQYGQLYAQKLTEAKVNLDLCTFASPSIPTCRIHHPHRQGVQTDWSDNGALNYLDSLHPTKTQLAQFDAIFLCNAPPPLITNIFPAITHHHLIYIPGPQITAQKNYLQPQLFPHTLLLFANQIEAQVIGQHQPLDHGIDTYVVTQGAEGGTVYQPHHTHHFSATPIPKPKNTTGAGDAFALGFTIEYLKSKNLDQAIQSGQKLAVDVLTQPATILPSYNRKHRSSYVKPRNRQFTSQS